MANEWVGVIQANAPLFVKGYEDLTIRNRYILSLLKQRGRLEYSQSGYECNWQVQFDQNNVNQYADGGLLDFNRSDLYRRCTLDWRAYTATDLMTKLEKAKNQGTTQLINRYNEIGKQLMKSIADKFGGELYKDGNETGRENCIHGIESFMGTGTTVAADRIAKPDDSYAGRNTDLGDQGGNWSTDLTTSPNANVDTDWPDGNGDVKYDFYSPKILNWSSTNWGTASQTWLDNCHFVISQGQTWLTMTGGKDAQVDVFVCAANLFQGYKNSLESLRRVIVPHKGANDLGFGNVINQDGMAVMADYDCPVNTGYFFNANKMKLSSLHSELFWTEGPTFDIRTLSWLWAVGFFGNAKFDVKWFGKTKNIAT